MKLSTESLARASAKHPWRTVVTWLALFILGALSFNFLFAKGVTNEQDFTYEPDAKRAVRILEEAGLISAAVDTEIVVIRSLTLSVDDSAFKDRVTGIYDQITALGSGVVTSPSEIPMYYALLDAAQQVDEPTIKAQLEAAAAGLISSGRNVTIIPVQMVGDVDQVARNIELLVHIASEANAEEFEVGVAGPAAIGADFEAVAESDLIVGESIGIAAAMVILLIVFRALGSVWIPLVVGAVAIMLAMGTASLIGQVYKLSFFVQNMIVMIGLAVGIDYSLFILARFREERSKGVEKMEAIARTGSTASRAVLFSGMTVVFSLLGLLIVPTTIFFSLGLGAIVVVLFSIILSLTLLPAILSLMGDRVNAWKIPFLRGNGIAEDIQHGFWNRVTRVVLAQPIVFLVIVGGGLVALSVPYFDIKEGFNGVQTLPDKFASKQAFQTLIAEFPRGQSPVRIAIDGDAQNRAAVDQLTAAIEGNTSFSGVRPYQLSEDGTVGLLEADLAVAADSEAANGAVRALRDEYIPAAGFGGSVYVAGDTAFNVDFFDLVDSWQPIVVAFVLALSFVLLTIVFRSLVVPVKAIILNLLSVGAAYGLLVLVFQKGYGADLFGFQQVDVIEAWIPLFLFSVLFGLSMDYEVFLLSRIRERFDQTGKNEESVAFGLRSTAGIITGAALIMVAVFTGFALGDLVMFQQMGFGLAAAIFVDATLIRAALVPATMKLLGNANWWLPKWLSWLPDLRVESHVEQNHSPVGAGE